MALIFRENPVLVTLILIAAVDCKRSINVAFPGSDCGNSPIEIYGARLYSSYSQFYANNACTMRFRSDDDGFSYARIRKNLKLNFKRFNITDCSVSLKVYFSPDTYGPPSVILDCHTVTIPPLFSGSSFVTLRLDKRTVTGYDFEIIITAYRQVHPTYICHGILRCNNGDCIERKLMCDGVDHCSDNSDEIGCASDATGSDFKVPHRLGSESIVTVSVAVGFFCLLFMLAILGGAVFFRRRRRQASFTHGQIIRLQQPLCVNQPAQNVTTHQGGCPYPQQPVQQYYHGPPVGAPGQAPYSQPSAPGYPMSQPQFGVHYQGPPPPAYPGQAPYPQHPLPT